MKLFLVSGFLGSGKTTAIQQASLELLGGKAKVGVITNDQGAQLVDSQFIQSFNIPTREVRDGCFCCNYDHLEESIQSLLEEDRPNIIFAESVGSCTDLISTVINPLEKFYPDRKVFVSTFADARVLPVLIKPSSHFFDDQIHYIYNKQLEEADLLVINKTDLLSDTELLEVKQLVTSRYPDKEVLYQNSLSKESIKAWLKILENHKSVKKRKSLDINYGLYGKGEAQLGWLDGEVEIQTADKKAVSIGYKLINKIFTTIQDNRLPIGHLKFFIRDQDGEWHRKISFTVSDQIKAEPELGELKTKYVSLLINARVQTRPVHLKEIAKSCIKTIESTADADVNIKMLSSFQPGFPKPTHRMMS